MGSITVLYSGSYFNFFSKTEYIIFGVIFVLLVIFIIYSRISYSRYKKIIKEKNEQIEGLINHSLAVTPEEFIKLRNLAYKGIVSVRKPITREFAGVYILHNETKDMYYVGQGKRVLDRVNSHFSGRGNGDVYADYRYGDSFTIRIIGLENSGFSNLNELEREMISYYNAYNKGYNKTRGNRG